MLPSQLDNFPAFFSENERALLKGTQLLNMMEQETKDIEKDYNLICEVVP